MKSLFILMVFLLSLIPLNQTYAHGNDDHEHAAPVATAAQVAPRATAQTEDFELVAVLQGRSLIIYLDRFADNQLVAGAQIEVESGTLIKAIAKQTAPGVYVLELGKGVFEKAGKYPLSISVQAGDVGDVMTASLDIPEVSQESPMHSDESASWRWPALGGVLFILALLGWAITRFMRTSRAAGEFK